MLEYRINDTEAVLAFLRALPEAIKRKRFECVGPDGLPQRAPNGLMLQYDWHTQYDTVLSIVDGQTVALADTGRDDDTNCRSASIVAHPGKGAYAINALTKLMQTFPAKSWCAELMDTAAKNVVIITRRYFHTGIDVIQTDIWRCMMKCFRGLPDSYVCSPIIIGTKLYREKGIKELSAADVMFLFRARAEQETVLSPIGAEIDPIFFDALIFDALKITAPDRAKISRSTFVLGMTKAYHLQQFWDEVFMLSGSEEKPRSLRSTFREGEGCLFDLTKRLSAIHEFADRSIASQFRNVTHESRNNVRCLTNHNSLTAIYAPQ